MDDLLNYVGIDPGFTGAIAVITADGVPSVQDMPTMTLQGKREYDPTLILRILRNIKASNQPLKVGLEWGTSRPGEQSERARRYGVGMGQLDMALFALRMDFARIAPQTWKTKLGLAGKQKKAWKEQCMALYDLYYPDHPDLIRGPQGGLKDGRVDALLIAHYLRLMSWDGIKGLAGTTDDVGRQAMLLGFGRTKFKGYGK